MRGAALFFGFQMLLAEEFRSKAHPENIPSSKTSLSLGYKRDGTETYTSPGDRDRFLLSCQDWLDDVYTEVEGFEECRSSFGLLG